jgi:hypothetical protein
LLSVYFEDLHGFVTDTTSFGMQTA